MSEVGQLCCSSCDLALYETTARPGEAMVAETLTKLDPRLEDPEDQQVVTCPECGNRQGFYVRYGDGGPLGIRNETEMLVDDDAGVVYEPPDAA